MLSVLLFPSLASSEEVNWNDLVRREGLYYKKFAEMPFTGEITGQTRGHLKDGVKDGHWVAYWADGQLMYKGSYKNGVEDGPWVSYHENGQLIDSESGTFRNGVNID